MKRIGIIGGSGYTGSELLRILTAHPKVEVVAVTSRKYEGKNIDEVLPFLKGFYDLKFVSPDVRNFDGCDLVFTAVPHGEAMNYVPELLDAGIKVVDLSADYRLSKEVYERVYGEHKAYLEAVYGLPEIHGEKVKKAELVANPGCYPTGCILAVYPIKDFIERVVFDCKSGITGAGAKASDFTHYPNLHEAIVPYKVTNHRHVYEMIQELECSVSFTPQVYPGSRGILTIAHVFLKDEVKDNLNEKEIKELYDKFYAEKPFVRLQESIRLSWVRGSNFCDISIKFDGERIVAISAIDNLVKGASGQAIQNMNLMLGFDEREGLFTPPLFP